MTMYPDMNVLLIMTDMITEEATHCWKTDKK